MAVARPTPESPLPGADRAPKHPVFDPGKADGCPKEQFLSRFYDDTEPRLMISNLQFGEVHPSKWLQ